MSDVAEVEVAAPVVPQTWSVYAIFEEGLEGFPFYVGITTNVERRIAQHNSCPSSAAYPHVKALEHVGTDCHVVVLGEFATEAEARLFESFHIAVRPNLRNRDIVSHRERLHLPHLFWSWLGGAHSMMIRDFYSAKSGGDTILGKVEP